MTNKQAENYKIIKDKITFYCAEGKVIKSNIEWGGGLYLQGTAITTLPDNLTVGGGLYLQAQGAHCVCKAYVLAEVQANH